MAKKTEESAKEPKKPNKMVELEGRVALLEEKIAKYRGLDQRITENGAAISRVRNCIGAVHK